MDTIVVGDRRVFHNFDNEGFCAETKQDEKYFDGVADFDSS